MKIQDWNIKQRSSACAISEKKFEEEEIVFSSLIEKDDGYQRLDVCKDVWEGLEKASPLLSSWQSTYKSPPPAPEEVLKKDDAEAILRVLLKNKNPYFANARYILAVMMERKRVLKMIERKQDENPILIYEHLKSGETWIIPEPKIGPQELESVQAQVSQILEDPQKFIPTED